MPSNIFFRTSAQRRNEATFLRDNRIIPPLMTAVCASTLQDLGVPCIWADSEADVRCVELAGQLKCCVLSKDSDFSILNAEGYGGYVPLDRVVWEYRDNSTPVADDEDGWLPATTKSKHKKTKPAKDNTLLHFGLSPPTSDAILAIRLVIHHPDRLAQHLKIPVTFLPLLSSLVGNDFVPKSVRDRFQGSKKKSPTDFIDHVAGHLRNVLDAGRDKRSKVWKRVAKNMESKGEASAPRPSVATLIQTAIQELLVRPATGEEVDGMVRCV